MVFTTDLLFDVARHAPDPTFVFALRRICKPWRDAIDTVDARSREWQETLEAFGVKAQLPVDADKKAAFVLLLCECRQLLQRCADHTLVVGAHGCATLIGSPPGTSRHHTIDGYRQTLAPRQRYDITEDMMLLLNWMLRVGECATISWLIPINDTLPRTPVIERAISLFGLLSAPDFDSARVLTYQEWRSRAPDLAGRIAERMHGAPAEDRRRALDSFESLTTFASCRMLHGLNQSWVHRLSYPTTREVGEAARNLLRARLFWPPDLSPI